jgi:CheY-like chemotaxis protein
MSSAQMNLLVVDDNVDLRISLFHTLSSFGHTVRCAEDGFAALAEIRNLVPDVLVSDLNMPGMSGFELLYIVRRRFPAIRVIAMSGAFSGEGLQLGVAADAFYQKGVDISFLFQLVEDLAAPDSPPLSRHPDKPAPIWIPKNGHYPSGEAFAIINCPECLRNFPQVLREAVNLIHETACIFCFNPIHYAVLQPTDPAAPQAFQRKPVVEMSLPSEVYESFWRKRS